MSLAGGRIKRCGNSKRGSCPLEFAAFTPTAGVPIIGTWPPTSMSSASGAPNNWNANISRCLPGSTVSEKDHRLFEIRPHARHCHWAV